MDAGVTYFMGIDPGKTGGIAVVDHLGSVIETHKMPTTERDLLDILFDLIEDKSGGMSTDPYGRAVVRAVLERVSASPQMGVTSAFTFGKGYGGLLMALTAARIPFDLVTPQTWQQAMGCRTGGDKNVSKARAQQLFPSVKVTHAIADSLLLAEYCRRYWSVGKGRTDGKEGSQDAGAEKAHGEGGDAVGQWSIQELAQRYEDVRPTIGAPVRVTLSRSPRAATPRHRTDPERRAR